MRAVQCDIYIYIYIYIYIMYVCMYIYVYICKHIYVLTKARRLGRGAAVLRLVSSSGGIVDWAGV